jgi:hypothetical protein
MNEQMNKTQLYNNVHQLTYTITAKNLVTNFVFFMLRFSQLKFSV